MSDQEAVAEISPAPEPEATAAPEAEVIETPEDHPPQKSFTQEELDAIVGKRLAREQRKWEREQALKLTEAQRQPMPSAPPMAPSLDDLGSLQETVEAQAIRRAHELVAQQEAFKQQAALLDAYHEREETARERYDDFEQVAYNPSLAVTDVMAKTIQASELGPEVIYWLGTNPKEAARISRLEPFLQAKEIGRIEARLASDPPVKKTSSAPAPISPVAARVSGGPVYETTDPRSIKSMNTSEWIENDRQRQIKALMAKQR